MSTNLSNAGSPIANRAVIPFRLDQTGSFSTELYAVNDTGTQPSGAYWVLSGVIDGQSYRAGYVITAAMAPTVDLDQLTPVDTPQMPPTYPINATFIQGYPVAGTAPVDGDSLAFVSGVWTPTTAAVSAAVAAAFALVLGEP